MDSLAFAVQGVPIAQGSKRHVGRGRMIESSKKLRPWRALVTAEAKNALLYADWEACTKAPVMVRLYFTMPRPKRVPRERRCFPVTVPDLDKLQRAVFDACTDAGVWHDDSQVVIVHAHKRYGIDPGVLVRVQELGTFDQYGED